ncbi:TadE-like protein [Micromonospora pattaloongensis]|uniref:TadE-like protein n=1 Tax=Micromonospora pattaloongensis TaxID=405436 RepID=A0A1H3NR21_9ACTN|nr:TadE family protein [Micromonospora pattaloongensis]SDY90895.1 TadE-like protein [Micromonospora pattaloongensis]
MRACPASLRRRTPPFPRTRPAGRPFSLRGVRPAAPGHDRGAAAVEMALVMPLLLLLLFGIIDFGRMLHAQITLTEAAREGARAESLRQPAGPRVTALTDRLGPVTMQTIRCAGAAPYADAVVTLSHPFEPVTPLGPIMRMVGGEETGAVTITAKGVMPCLG